MITTKQFVNALEEVYISKKKEASTEDFISYGRHRGWLDEQNIIQWEQNIERRHAAVIFHEFLRIEFGVEDLRDWSNANKLKDLYDCRVCAKHVAQVVERQIMPPLEPKRFMLLRPVSEDDFIIMLERLKNVIEDF